jgi:hypothetical protein
MEFVLLAVVIFIVFALLLVYSINVRFTIQRGGALPAFPSLGIDIKAAVAGSLGDLNRAISNLQTITNTFKDNTVNFAMSSNLKTDIDTAISDTKSALETALKTLETNLKTDLTIKI